jgi:uncharacterized membrane protein YpjA
MTKQIDIKELIPLLNEGWVACNKYGTWIWSAWELVIDDNEKCWKSDNWWIILSDSYMSAFDIVPAKDWKNSLIKIERK